MPIVVKHSGNATAAAYGSYGAGKGKRAQQDSATLGRLSAQNKSTMARAQSQERNRALSMWENQQNRKFTAKRDALNRDFQREQGDLAHERSLETMELQGEMRSDFAEEQMGRQKELYDYEISAKRREEYNRLSDAYDEAVESGNYSEDELKEIKSQIIAKQAGISGNVMPRMKKKSPWPEGQGIGQSWQTEDGKFLLTRDEKGNIKKVADTNTEPTYKDHIAAWDKAIELSREGEEQKPNMDKAREYYNEIMLSRRNVLQEDAGPAPDGGGPDYTMVPGGVKTKDGLVLNSPEGLRAFRKQQNAKRRGEKSTEEGHSGGPVKQLLSLPEETLKQKVKEAAERKGVSEDIIWQMIERERSNQAA